MKKITCYESEDGKIHRTEAEAASHETRVRVYTKLEEMLTGSPVICSENNSRDDIRQFMLNHAESLATLLTDYSKAIKAVA